MAHMEEPELPDQPSSTPSLHEDSLGTGGTGGTSQQVVLKALHSVIDDD